MTTQVSSNRFGPVNGVDPGQVFENRQALRRAGVHAPTENGISGTQELGCDSIVLNGAHPDLDLWHTIIYSGEKPRGGSNTDDQVMKGGNLALKLSHDNELPVRVTRGSKIPQGPANGYRYDGLYRVSKFWRDKDDGRIVWKYRLDKIFEPISAESTNSEPTARRLMAIDTIVRDASLARRIKKIYDSSCQVCGESLESPSGPYVEAAHIKPLGAPDDGPDIEENLLCLCPNHHKLLDHGGIVVDEEWNVIRVMDEKPVRRLSVKSRHNLTQEYLRWHRQRWT